MNNISYMHKNDVGLDRGVYAHEAYNAKKKSFFAM
jgi:hypothetical protein